METSPPEQLFALWDWRRRVTEVYADVRASSDPYVSWQLWRTARDELFGNHPQTPIDPSRRRSFSGLSYFEYDASLRMLISLVPKAGERMKIDLARDGVISLIAFGRTQGLAERFGGELSVYWIEGYGGGVFLPFKDATNSGETYGGGRYLLDTIKGSDLGRTNDGRTILDFNFAYHPSCSYSDLWVCPLAPAENVLPAAVRGGERHAKHD